MPRKKTRAIVDVTITPNEHAIVRRLKTARDEVSKDDGADEIDNWAFAYGFFLGAGIPVKRAVQFTLLVCYDTWENDPIFDAPLDLRPAE